MYSTVFQFEFGEVTATVEFSCDSGAFYTLVKKVPAFSIQTRITQLGVAISMVDAVDRQALQGVRRSIPRCEVTDFCRSMWKPKSRRPEAPVRCWRDQRIAQYDAGAMTTLTQ